jgi:pimeloyl-ACP methyl ester carboxylesterase
MTPDRARPTVGQVELPDRGLLLVWQCPGPAGAPTLVLLHGVAMTAELAWSSIIARLGEHFRIVAPDLRGHGDGLPARQPYDLAECADDVAALADHLGIEQLVAVGYSMGGMVAQELWRRHRRLVSGLVLCASARNVRGSRMEQLAFIALPLLAASIRLSPMTNGLTAEPLEVALGDVPAEQRPWVGAQFSRTRLTTALSAIQAVGAFSSRDWITAVDVPTAVLVTMNDRLVPPSRQRRLANAIPGAWVLELPADHGVCVNAPTLFAKGLLTAADVVTGARRSDGTAAERKDIGDEDRPGTAC